MAENLFEDETIITLTDEEGNENQFEHIATCELDGCTYYALVPLDGIEDEEGEYVILKIDVDDDGEEILVTIDDDDEFERVADYFDDKFASEDLDYDN